MKISGRFVTVTDSQFVPDRLAIFEGEAITFKLELKGDNPVVGDVYQVFKVLKGNFLVEILGESFIIKILLSPGKKDEFSISSFELLYLPNNFQVSRS